MIYGEVLAINSIRSAYLEPTPDRWGRSGVRPAPAARTGRRKSRKRVWFSGWRVA